MFRTATLFYFCHRFYRLKGLKNLGQKKLCPFALQNLSTFKKKPLPLKRKFINIQRYKSMNQ
ncbi:hypothetical protein B0A64_00395 [Flavobacterium araucananum]|uniref:Uncharacterized protein n=1 Tax=Flavobacterium araucananum TaxID=946678 RepID=A0A227PHA1_9FLAO|nr:hypothetical protein B0A64_00395 [Flavobacterium araucananum]